MSFTVRVLVRMDHSSLCIVGHCPSHCWKVNFLVMNRVLLQELLNRVEVALSWLTRGLYFSMKLEKCLFIYKASCSVFLKTMKYDGLEVSNPYLWISV